MGLRKHEGQGCILADEMYNQATLTVCWVCSLESQGSRENIAGACYDTYSPTAVMINRVQT